jgi:UDP-GlcNAc:undecaprenyl-phosphate GlcNAc-1-phosphate transferase
VGSGGTHIAIIGIAAFASVAVLIPLVRWVAVSYDVFDHPKTGKLHTATTPYLGGLAIVIVGLGTSAFLPKWSVQGVGILLGALVVGLVGLVDDVRTLGPLPRVLFEAMAASLAFATGARVFLVNAPVDWLLTVIWLVVLTNSFNLLDNMDGAAGLVGTATAIALAVAAMLGGQVLVGGLAAVVAGSCAGFLLYNWYPARIFMGDAGSLFLGFLLASLALKLRFPVHHLAALAAVALLAGLALFDTTLVVVSRWRDGRPIYLGGTDHTSHRLLRLGLSTPLVGVALLVATAFCSSLGVAVGRGLVPAWVIVPVAVTGVALIPAFLAQKASDEEGTVATVQEPPSLVLEGSLD